jgi:dUTP pyrophosphatase
MLRVRLLDENALLPVVAHPGEDLGYDLFALEATLLPPHITVKVRTGIAVEARHPSTDATTAGVIDAGYRGEILVLMTNLGQGEVELKAGEKIAQMIPVPVLTGPVQEVETLEVSARAEKGFGSSGR